MISIDDVLTNQISENIRKEIETKQKIKEKEITYKENALREEMQSFEELKKSAQIEVNKKVAEKLATEKITLWKQAKIEANKEQEVEK